LKNLNRIVVALCALALAVPAAVMAQGPDGHGKSGEDHGRSQQHVSKGCKHQPMVGYNYGGKLDASSTADAIVINVTRASHAAKALKGSQVTLSADDSHKARFNGPNPFTTENPDLTTYKVQVIGKVGKARKKCNFENSASTVKKVLVNAPDSSDDDQDEQTPQG
jgi:hypothetical protein